MGSADCSLADVIGSDHLRVLGVRGKRHQLWPQNSYPRWVNFAIAPFVGLWSASVVLRRFEGEKVPGRDPCGPTRRASYLIKLELSRVFGLWLRPRLNALAVST
jgi:hypothetical protein